MWCILLDNYAIFFHIQEIWMWYDSQLGHETGVKPVTLMDKSVNIMPSNILVILPATKAYSQLF